MGNVSYLGNRSKLEMFIPMFRQINLNEMKFPLQKNIKSFVLIFIYPSLHSAFHQFHCIIPKPSYSFKISRSLSSEKSVTFFFDQACTFLLSTSSCMYNEPDLKTKVLNLRKSPESHQNLNAIDTYGYIPLTIFRIGSITKQCL